ncbi:pilus assembly protein TadG-related protein [Catenuloplanes japonicus]|uniref:pilus assembly protein TadG-related protein n=1 Tax=Catenuloplanes japonicus TaxID=33876 RepID=UPI00052614A6|nr:pilus assembly protein TadG-related protein [Catenuloplanes japonicus]
MPRLTEWRPRRRDRGAVAVLVSMMITSGMVFGLGALTVDVGLIYAERAQLQTAADAAAIAVAKVCAMRRPECNEDLMLLEGGRYARQNVKDAGVEVSAVCGVVHVPASEHKPIQPCLQPASNLTACLGSRSGDYIEVRVRTARDGETSALPPVFAGAVTGTDGVTVAACARASWRAIGTVKDALPVVFSECVVAHVVGEHGLQPEPSGAGHAADPKAEVTLPFREIGREGDGYGYCRNPGWTRAPGERPSDATDGFGGEVTGSAARCDASFDIGTIRELSGAAGGNEEEFWEHCFATLVGLHEERTPVPVGVYRPADGDRAYIDSVRRFVVTGWRRSGWPPKETGDALPGDRWSQPPPSDADADCPVGTESCLFGYFTTDPDGGGAAGPTSIRITG